MLKDLIMESSLVQTLVVSCQEMVDVIVLDKLLFLIIPYLISQPLLKMWVKKTNFYENNKAWCKKVMGTYNVIMSIYSALACFGIWYTAINYAPDGVFGVNHFAEETGWYKWIGWTFYMSKYVEFLDTWFLILCGRPVSWLQYLHHIGAPISMSMGYSSHCEGCIIFVGLNGFIHTIMYYYYAACIMKWYMPMKQMLTSMQLFQFFVATSATIYYAVSFPGPEFYGDMGKRACVNFSVTYTLMCVALFANFYVKTYLKKTLPRRVSVHIKVPDQIKLAAANWERDNEAKKEQ